MRRPTGWRALALITSSTAAVIGLSFGAPANAVPVKVTAKVAQVKVLKKIKGTVLSITPSKRDGFTSWAVKVKRADGSIVIGYVDAKSGIIFDWTVQEGPGQPVIDLDGPDRVLEPAPVPAPVPLSAIADAVASITGNAPAGTTGSAASSSSQSVSQGETRSPEPSASPSASAAERNDNSGAENTPNTQPSSAPSSSTGAEADRPSASPAPSRSESNRDDNRERPTTDSRSQGDQGDEKDDD